eukprot:4751458-Pyramimonas_sp.AAC.1
MVWMGGAPIFPGMARSTRTRLARTCKFQKLCAVLGRSCSLIPRAARPRPGLEASQGPGSAQSSQACCLSGCACRAECN